MNIKPYLQLIRLPNLFTAAADSLAGYVIVRGSFAKPAEWLPLCVASMAIYASGIALNDLFDYEIDQKERPGRPLPSGRVSRRFAAILGVAGLTIGLAMAALVSIPSLIVAAVLVASVLLYDVGLKRTILGPEIMGTCRGLNLLLGLSVVPGFGGPIAWLAAGSLGLFVVGLTWISRSEVESGRSAGVIVGTCVQNLAFAGLLAAAFQASRFAGADGGRPIVPVEGLLVLALVIWVVNAFDGRAIFDPNPQTIQKAVKTGVLSLIWIDVGLVAALRGPGPALMIAALWVPAFLLGKWLYST